MGKDRKSGLRGDEIRESYSDLEIRDLVESGVWSESDAQYYLGVRDLPLGSAGNTRNSGDASEYPTQGTIPGATRIGNVRSKK